LTIAVISTIISATAAILLSAKPLRAAVTMKTILTTIIGAILTIGIHAGPNGKLSFFGGVTDPNVNAFPDTIFTSLGIYNQATAIYSDLQYAMQTGPNSFNWSSFDAMTSFCVSNNLKRTWYGMFAAAVTQPWLDGNGLSGQALVTACTNFVAAAAARSPDIPYINFCNEGILHSDASGTMQQAFGGAGATGYNWIINIGKLFRQYFPNARLGVNDYNFESAGNDLPYSDNGSYGNDVTQLPKMLNAIRILKQAGVIDWVGMEAYSLETVSSANLTSAFNQIGALGVNIILTEFSPDAYVGPGADPNKVSADWQRLFPLCYGNQYVIGVTGPWDYRWSNTQNGGIGGSQFFVDDRTNPYTIEPVVNYLRGIVPSVVNGPSPDPRPTPVPAPTPTVKPGPEYVQGAYSAPQTPQSTVTVPFPNAQTAGDLNIAMVGWNDDSTQISSVTDSNGNTYRLAVGPTTISGGISQSIYYATISESAAGTNAVRVTFASGAAYPDVRVLEYRGIDTSNPVDTVAQGTGNGNFSRTAYLTTAKTNDILVSANTVSTTTSGSGKSSILRMLTSPDGDIAQDSVLTNAGSYYTSAPLTSSGIWVMQAVAFRSVNQ
jgi:GH35 family endo-1,4-beta-xylanase